MESRYESCRGKKCLDWFIEELTDIAMDVFEYLEDKKPMKPLTEEEEKASLMQRFVIYVKKNLPKKV